MTGLAAALIFFATVSTVSPATAALARYGGTVIKASLSEEDTKALQEALTPDEAAS